MFRYAFELMGTLLTTSLRFPRLLTWMGASLAAVAFGPAAAAQATNPPPPTPSPAPPAAAPAPEQASQPLPGPTPVQTSPVVQSVGPNECQPVCRDGFVCIEGSCVSACNPPCSDSEQCTSDGRCVLPEYESDEPAAAPALDAPAAEPPSRRPTRLERRRQAVEERLEHRTRPRAVFGMRLGIQNVDGPVLDDVTVRQLGIQLGYRQNFAEHFGLLAVFDASLGGWNEFDDFVGDAGGDTRGLRVQLSPYFGPMGRFAIGPVLTVGRNWYIQEDEDGNSIGDAEGIWMGGYGVQGGLLLGRREEFMLHFILLCFGEERDAPDFLTGDSVEGSITFGYGF